MKEGWTQVLECVGPVQSPCQHPTVLPFCQAKISTGLRFQQVLERDLSYCTSVAQPLPLVWLLPFPGMKTVPVRQESSHGGSRLQREKLWTLWEEAGESSWGSREHPQMHVQPQRPSLKNDLCFYQESRGCTRGL